MSSQDDLANQVLLERVLKQLGEIQSVALLTQQRLDILEGQGASRDVQRNGQPRTEETEGSNSSGPRAPVLPPAFPGENVGQRVTGVLHNFLMKRFLSTKHCYDSR